MKIHLKAKIPGQNIDIEDLREIPENTSIEQLLIDLGIKSKEAGYFLIAVNNQIEDKNYILKDGDRVSILPALIGG